MNTSTKFEQGEIIENTRAHVDPNCICDGCVHSQPISACAISACAIYENKLNKKKKCVDTVFAPIHHLIFGIRE